MGLASCGNWLDRDLIRSPDRALSVFDFREVARKKLPPAHFGFIASGVDDNVTLRANREELSRIKIRVRRLIDVGQIDTQLEMFGEKWETPIILAPASSQGAFHEDGEIATARAAKNKKHLQILSTYASKPIEEVTEARGAPVWYQLYPAADWKATESMIRRAEAAGCPVVVLTVDSFVRGNKETVSRFKRKDRRRCQKCHDGQPISKPMVSRIGYERTPPLTWDFVRKLKDNTSMRLLIKGIVTSEDARLCLENGVDGVVVSNHGGRAEESGRATIECLPEVVRAVNGQIPVLIDGGFRRGTDVFKALALGAKAICIGRPYLWGLGAFGQAGVERVLVLMRAELGRIMKQAGTPSLEEINRNFVLTSFGERRQGTGET